METGDTVLILKLVGLDGHRALVGKLIYQYPNGDWLAESTFGTGTDTVRNSSSGSADRNPRSSAASAGLTCAHAPGSFDCHRPRRSFFARSTSPAFTSRLLGLSSFAQTCAFRFPLPARGGVTPC
jgi:hypothetical protein